MSYSRAHYRLVSPRADTPSEIAWRLRDNEFRAQALRERVAQFPTITPDNFQAASDWFEQRLRDLHDASKEVA